MDSLTAKCLTPSIEEGYTGICNRTPPIIRLACCRYPCCLCLCCLAHPLLEHNFVLGIECHCCVHWRGDDGVSIAKSSLGSSVFSSLSARSLRYCFISEECGGRRRSSISRPATPYTCPSIWIQIRKHVLEWNFLQRCC